MNLREKLYTCGGIVLGAMTPIIIGRLALPYHSESLKEEVAKWVQIACLSYIWCPTWTLVGAVAGYCIGTDLENKERQKKSELEKIGAEMLEEFEKKFRKETIND